jgi:hypothetical protein
MNRVPENGTKEGDMRRWRIKAIALALLCAALAAPPVSEPVWAQSTIGNRPMTLWVDNRTGQVFIRPGRGRVPLVMPTGMTPQLERQLDERVDEKTQAIQSELTKQQTVNASLAQSNAQLTQQLGDMKPAWTNFADNFMNKFSIGTLWYFDYAMYTHPSFGPQFLTQINQPGPGNETFNSFDLSRAYLNFLFTPTKDITVRVSVSALSTPTCSSTRSSIRSRA